MNWIQRFLTAIATHKAEVDAHHTPGSLAATCFVVASDAKAETKAWATILQAVGYPVWLCSGADDDVEIQAAIDAAGGADVQLSEGEFVAANTLTLPDNTSLKGRGCGATLITADLAVAAIESSDQSVSKRSITVADLIIDMVDSTAGSIGIDFTNIHSSLISNVRIIRTVTGIKLETAGAGVSYYNTIINPVVQTGVSICILIISGNSTNIFGGRLQPDIAGGKGISITVGSQIGIYGPAIDLFEVGIETAGQLGIIVNPRLENAVAGTSTGIILLAGAGGNGIIFPYFANLFAYLTDNSGNTTNTYYGEESYVGWTSYVPTVTSSGGAPTTTTAVGLYRRQGSRVYLQVKVTITDKGTATGYMLISVPIAKRNRVGQPAWTAAFSETAVTGAMGIGSLGQVDLNNIYLNKYDATTPWTDGYVWEGSIVYECLD